MKLIYPKNLNEALCYLSEKEIDDHSRWILLSIILKEICLAKGIDLEEEIK